MVFYWGRGGGAAGAPCRSQKVLGVQTSLACFLGFFTTKWVQLHEDLTCSKAPVLEFKYCFLFFGVYSFCARNVDLPLLLC